MGLCELRLGVRVIVPHPGPPVDERVVRHYLDTFVRPDPTVREPPRDEIGVDFTLLLINLCRDNL